MNIYDAIKKEANSLGFTRVFFTKPQKIDVGDTGLVADALEKYEWTSCVLLLVYPYKPFIEGEVVSAYYLASNESYHKLKTLITSLNEMGIKAKRLNLSAKKVAEHSHIGAVGKNTLLRLSEYGSRIVLYTVAIDTVAPLEYQEFAPDCGKCTLCIDACPTNAIGDTPNDYDKTKCIRYYMEDETYPQWVEENINMYMGCERCMFACPHNKKIVTASPSTEVKQAFDCDTILSGNTENAKQLVGTNIEQSRLIRDAKILKNKKLKQKLLRRYLTNQNTVSKMQ
ncbi:MAG: hypothetical protein GX802_05645 [Clostridiales bacterium]|nr:hypothetical protein [Clostridiales bacterium]